MIDMFKSIVGLALCIFVTGAAIAAPPPPSPGQQLGLTAYDHQGHGSSGHRIARLPGSDTVHLAWMFSDDLGQFAEDFRTVKFLSVDLFGGALPDTTGVLLGSSWWDERPGYPSVAVGSANDAVVAYHKKSGDVGGVYASWLADFIFPPTYLHVDNELTRPFPSCPEALWPQVAVGLHPGGDDITHIIGLDNLNIESCADPLLWYWRRDASGIHGPVVIDTVRHLNYCIAADPQSGRTAVVFSSTVAGLVNLHYYESVTEGTGWISGSELGAGNRLDFTNYTDSAGPQAWGGLAAEYDNDGVLHVVWVEQTDAYNGKQCALVHWDNESGVIREITRADWPLPLSTGVFNLGLAGISMGIGDGSTLCQSGAESNENYLYVVYTQFAGPTAAEQADHSYDEYGRYNGELYLTVSRDGGASWSNPVNLSNTKTPSCTPGPADGPNGEPYFPDSVCRSEMWASIGKYVSDIDLLFISDLDAGGIVQGEGSWQLNPVHYYRIPGGTTDAAFVCPNFQSAMMISGSGTNSVCGSHSIDGVKTDTTTYMISNTGNAILVCSLRVEYQGEPAPTEWLRLNDSTQSLTLAIPPGGTEEVYLIADPANLLASVVYRADVFVLHNAPNQPSPLTVSIDFSVAPCNCHADPVCDGAIDVLDVVDVIGIAFRGMPSAPNESCPALDEDVDCSGNIDVLDVVHVIAVAFRGQTEDGEFCQPCSNP